MFHTAKVAARTRGLLVVAVSLLYGCSDLHDTTLANGLRVIVKEDHRSPVVVSMVWYKVGSVDEPEGITGISHVLEHMMFKGTERYKPNEYSRIVAEQGGRENAFTSYDYTAYFQQLEKSRLPIAFELEADRMQNLKLDEAEFRKEIQVVMEERRLRTDDQPEALAYERFGTLAYKVHPYRHPVIGWMPDLERLTLDQVSDWYRRWYTPNNAVVVVVGDVKPKAVVELAKKYFGAIPARPTQRTPIPPEPPQQEPRRDTVRLPAQVPYLLMGYHVPVLEPQSKEEQPQSPAHEPWEPFALTVLAGVLDGGESARFERELVREQRVAARIGTDYTSVARDPTMMLFSGTPTAEHTTADLEQGLRAQIERIKREPVSAQELERVKAQVVASDVFRRDSVFNQAMQIGRLALADLDLDLLDESVKRLRAVTAEQVSQVARKYLNDPNLTVTVLDPLPPAEAPKRPRPAVPGGRSHAR